MQKQCNKNGFIYCKRSSLMDGNWIINIEKYYRNLGCCSNDQVDHNQPIALIVKGVDNFIDTMTIIEMYRFKTVNKMRIATLETAFLFGQMDNGKQKLIRYIPTKYRENSNILEMLNLEPGEYGNTISNLKAIDGKKSIYFHLCCNLKV